MGMRPSPSLSGLYPIIGPTENSRKEPPIYPNIRMLQFFSIGLGDQPSGFPNHHRGFEYILDTAGELGYKMAQSKLSEGRVSSWWKK
jgi:hypothetical protein